VEVEVPESDENKRKKARAEERRDDCDASRSSTMSSSPTSAVVEKSIFAGISDAELLARPWTRKLDILSEESRIFYFTYDVFPCLISRNNFGLCASTEFSSGDIICETRTVVSYADAFDAVVRSGSDHIYRYLLVNTEENDKAQQRFFDVDLSPIWLINSAQPGDVKKDNKKCNCLFVKKKGSDTLQVVAIRKILIGQQLLEMYDASPEDILVYQRRLPTTMGSKLKQKRFEDRVRCKNVPHPPCFD
jgi:hypothetical protein